MLFDILAVFVVSIVSSLLLCTTSLHGLPPPSTLHLINSRPSADLSSSLRHLRQHYSLPSVDNDVVGGEDSEMLIGESNESPLPHSSTNSNDDDNDDSSSSSSFPAASSPSSGEISNEPFDFYLQLSPAKSLSREFLSPQNHHQQTDQHKRASFPSLASNFNFHSNSAASVSTLADASNANNVVNLNQLSESTRLSPSLKIMVEKNPLLRAWLALLLQKMTPEQPVPYIFKYGRRRKK